MTVKDPARRHEEDLRLALVLADMADSLTMERFGASDLQVASKPDMTWVTDADKECEKLLRRQLAQSRSRDAVVGEEAGASGFAARRWVIDPIDGTSNYVRGVPVWATLIGLIEGNEVVASVVSAPALGRRWWASKGKGAWTGRSFTRTKQIRASQVSYLADSSISYSELGEWAQAGKLRAFMQLLQKAWRTRAYGDFWSYMLLAEGAVDIAGEPELNLWDMAALVPIVTEAGGRFTDLNGVDGPFGAGAIATNGILHEEVLQILAQNDE